MTTAKSIDNNGFLLVKGCPISSFGIFDYGAGQLGLGGDPMRIVKVYRPESAVNDPAAIESFKNVPLINDHEMLSGFKDDENATAPEEHGVAGVLTSNVYYDSPWMRGDLKVFSREMQELLNKGKKDLSLGYSCDFELKSGIFDGQAYEAVQTNLRGNHIALVDEGRVAGARVLDGLCFDHLRFDVPSDKGNDMSKKVTSGAMDNAVAQLKALLPALEQYLNEEASEPAHQDATGGENAEQTQSVNPEPESTDPSEMEQDETGGASDLPTLIQNVEAVLAQLKGMVPNAENNEGEGNDESSMEQAEVNKPQGAAATDSESEPAAQGEGTAEAEAAGLSKTASDAALQHFYADVAAKGRIYDRLSKVVGAFDCSAMDSRQVAEYGVKKLGIKCDTKFAATALDAYLVGIEKAEKTTQHRVTARAADSKAASSELDAYLKGTK